jgi:hypothetical protein
MQKVALTKREWKVLHAAITAYADRATGGEWALLESVANKASLAGLSDAAPIVGRHGWAIHIDDSSELTIEQDIKTDVADMIRVDEDQRIVRVERDFCGLGSLVLDAGIPHRVVRRVVIENAHLLDSYADEEETEYSLDAIEGLTSRINASATTS